MGETAADSLDELRLPGLNHSCRECSAGRVLTSQPAVFDKGDDVATVEKATQTINGAQIFIEMLIRMGTDTIYAYPVGCSMPMLNYLREQRDLFISIVDLVV
ncbi:MAG: hypothetical protein ACK58L_22390, partial [Planctomycetota bacterium]